MSLIFDDEEKPLIALEPLSMAVRLKGIVRSKLKCVKPVRDSGWAEDFRLLVKEAGGDPIRVERVLDWYSAYCDDPDARYKCRSAKAFRSMFYALEELCQKKAQQQVKMCATAIEAAARLRELARWHNGSDAKLDSVVKRSVDAYAAFRKKVIHSDTDGEVDAFVAWAYPELVRDPADFVVGWLIVAYRRVQRWKDWSGDMEPFVFSESCQRLRDYGSDLAASFGDRSLWQKLLDSINKEAS